MTLGKFDWRNYIDFINCDRLFKATEHIHDRLDDIYRSEERIILKILGCYERHVHINGKKETYSHECITNISHSLIRGEFWNANQRIEQHDLNPELRVVWEL